MLKEEFFFFKMIFCINKYIAIKFVCGGGGVVCYFTPMSTSFWSNLGGRICIRVDENQSSIKWYTLKNYLNRIFKSKFHSTSMWHNSWLNGSWKNKYSHCTHANESALWPCLRCYLVCRLILTFLNSRNGPTRQSCL